MAAMRNRAVEWAGTKEPAREAAEFRGRPAIPSLYPRSAEPGNRLARPRTAWIETNDSRLLRGKRRGKAELAEDRFDLLPLGRRERLERLGHLVAADAERRERRLETLDYGRRRDRSAAELIDFRQSIGLIHQMRQHVALFGGGGFAVASAAS